jgi:hypothetical protein
MTNDHIICVYIITVAVDELSSESPSVRRYSYELCQCQTGWS